jgi:hypothetical protein
MPRFIVIMIDVWNYLTFESLFLACEWDKNYKNRKWGWLHLKPVLHFYVNRTTNRPRFRVRNSARKILNTVELRLSELQLSKSPIIRIGLRVDFTNVSYKFNYRLKYIYGNIVITIGGKT